MKKIAALLVFVLSLGTAFAAPTISNVFVTATTATTATIQWNTDTPSSSMLKYGTDPSLPYANNVTPALTTTHSMTLVLLSAGPMYYVAAVSADNSGLSQSSAITFSLCGSPMTPVNGTATNYYQYGTYSLSWQPPAGSSGTATVCGQAVQTLIQGNLDGGASFNNQVADASKIVPGPGQWQVNVIDAGNLAPISITAYLSQVTQNVSAQLQTAAVAAGLQNCLTNTITSQSWPPSCGGGATAAVTSINTVPGAFTFGAGSSCTGTNCVFPGTGVATLNGLSGAVNLVAGANITLSIVNNNLTITSTGGGGGGGPLGTLVNDLVTNNSGNTAAQDIYNFQATPSYSAQNAITQALANDGVVTLLPGVNGGFTNTNNYYGVKVLDLANLGAMARSVTEQGAWCDQRESGVSIPQGSTTLTIYNDYFYPGDIGKTVTLIGTVTGIPTAFETKIIGLVGQSGGRAPQATIATPAPFTAGNTLAAIAHDDTVAINQALVSAAANQQSSASYFTALLIPGGVCSVHTLTYTGVSMEGLNGIISGLAGFPGEDILSGGDSAAGTNVEGLSVHIHDLHFVVNNQIDATKPWQIINDSGTVSKPALYRPVCINCVTSNNPLSPGWFQGAGPNATGAYNGDSSVTAGSGVICTPTALAAPPVGNTIVFPYLGSVFTTTVQSVAGTCGSGTARTLTLPMPGGSTGSQVEWFTGSSVQHLASPVTSGACPASVTVVNPVTPAPASETNVAPYGLIKIDGEQMTYFGRTNAFYGGLSTQYLTITGCAQNGTLRASHSTGATVVPLNPFVPAVPFPVFPTLTAGTTTPSVAAMYPSWNVGNAAFAWSNTNGNLGQVGAGSFANSLIENIQIDSYPTSNTVNHTAGIYLVGLPYSTTFRKIVISGTYFGIEEGTPSYQTGGAWTNAQPTADGSNWEEIRISGCDIFDFISGGQNSFRDFNVYSDCYDPVSGTYTGADAGMYFTAGWNDEYGYLQSNQNSTNLDNMYTEGEFGSKFGLVPLYEFDLGDANWSNLHMGSATETYIGGHNQKFIGGNFNAGGNLPVINYGIGNTSDQTQLLWADGAPGGVGQTYGVNAFINYGVNTGFSSALGSYLSAPYGSTQAGSSREPWHGQNETTWIMGNVAVPFVNENGGYIPASEFNNSYSWEPNPFNVPYYYDANSPSGGTTGCTLDTGGAQACFTYNFNTGGAIVVGPAGRIVPGKYTFYVASHSTGVATSYHILVGVCSFGDVANLTVPVTSSYSVQSFQVDLTGKTCGGGLSMDFIYAAPAADTISVAYVDFAPVAMQPTDYNIYLLNQVLINGDPGTPGYCFVAGTPDAWAPCGSTIFQVGGTGLISSGTVNFVGGTNITITNPSAGEILITSTGGGSGAFSGITSGTNTSAAMLVGSGSSLGIAGSGTISATSVPFAGVLAGTDNVALVIGSGGSLSVSGGGTINATAMPFSGLSNGTNTNALLIGSGGSFAATGSGTIAATTAAALAGTPSQCSTGSAPTGISANGNIVGCAAYLTGSLTSGTFPVATGTFSLANSLLSVAAGNTLNWAGAGGIEITGVTTPGAWSLISGTGSIGTLPTGSGGFAAPNSGGTSYLYKLMSTVTAGYLFSAAPATNDGVNESALSSQGVEWNFAANTFAPGIYASGAPIGSAVAYNGGHAHSLSGFYEGGGCTTPPIIQICDVTTSTCSASLTLNNTGQATTGSLGSTVPYGPGDLLQIKIVTAGAGCSGGNHAVSAQMITP